MSTCFVLVRAIHMAACLLVFGVCVFDRFVVGRAVDGLEPAVHAPWSRIAGRLHLICLPTILLSGAAWFALVVIAMSGLPPGDALRQPIILEVFNQTQFGMLWKVRGVLWLVALISIVAELRTRRAVPALPTYVAMVLSAALVASLAWSGHGSAGELPAAHLAADAIHLLASGGWPTGLLPMLLVLLALRPMDVRQKWTAIAAMVRRFSIMSLSCVALLIATGLVNSWILVGSVAGMRRTPYGRTLSVKVALFLAMIAIGAVNLLVLKPRLAAQSDADVRRLRRNVAIELALGTAVMIAVGLLGLMQPAVEQ